MEKETQIKNVRDFLLTGKSITPIEALNLFGCFRLAAVIYDLKHDYGFNIITEMVYDGRKKYARYFMKGE